MFFTKNQVFNHKNPDFFIVFPNILENSLILA